MISGDAMGLETSMQDLKRQMEKQLKHAEILMKYGEMLVMICSNAFVPPLASTKVSAKSLLGSVRT